MIPVTFGTAKLRLARAYGGAQGVTDARVMEWCNYAQEAIIRDLAGFSPDGKPWTPRGIYVGGFDQLSLSTNSSGVFTLPATHEVALEVETLATTDINNGWMSELSMAGTVDPDFVNDLVFLDQGLDISNQRTYFIPDPAQRGSLKVTAKKRFVAATGDASALCVPNVEAVVAMMMALQARERRDSPDGGEPNRLTALRSMQAEVNGYLLDPTKTAYRKSLYLLDEKTYATAPASLGYLRARLANDLLGALRISKTGLTRGLNRIVERLVQRTNEIRTTGRARVKTGLANLVFTRASSATDTFAVSDYEQIRALATAFLDPSVAEVQEKRAYDLLEAQETNALETLRHAAYSSALTAYTAANQLDRLGYFVGKLSLDPEHPEWIRLSDVEMRRLINESVREAIQHRNSLSATEIYSNEDGPDVLEFRYAQTDADPLQHVATPEAIAAGTDSSWGYAEFEVVRLLFMAQAAPDQAGNLREEAYRLIERNLAKAVRAARNQKWNCLVKQFDKQRQSFGFVRGTIGLGLGEMGFNVSDQRLSRLLNEAEENLSRLPNFVGGEGEYQLGCVDGEVEMPEDVERVIFADVCGYPVEVRHRSFEYLGFPQGTGVQGGCRQDGAWLWWGQTGLQDRGLSEDGNRRYFVSNCSRGGLRVIAKRRWLPKRKDSAPMLVQNLEALRKLVEAKLAREGKDLASAAALENAADQAMDRQLDNHHGAATVMPRINFPGSTTAYARRLSRSF